MPATSDQVQVLEEGKFRIQTVGPVKSGIGKTSGKPWKTYDLQFDGDPQWYTTYWGDKEYPAIGRELEGKKEFNEKFNSYQFNQRFAGNKANWNPAGANAQVMQAAVAVVNGFLSLKGAHLQEWESRRKEGQSAMSHYMQTVILVAGMVKQEVVKMGGNETQAATQTSQRPPADGDPGPTAPPTVDSWPENGEESVDLGPM